MQRNFFPYCWPPSPLVLAQPNYFFQIFGKCSSIFNFQRGKITFFAKVPNWWSWVQKILLVFFSLKLINIELRSRFGPHLETRTRPKVLLNQHTEKVEARGLSLTPDIFSGELKEHLLYLSQTSNIYSMALWPKYHFILWQKVI